MKILFSSLAFIEQHKRLSRIRGELVQFRALKVTCVLVSLACPISSDVLINANHSEESLVNEPMNCAPTAQGLPFAPIAVPPTAELPIAPAFAAGLPIAPATIPLPVLAVPIAYAIFFHQPRHRHEILSTDAVSSLQTAWTDLTPSLDHQDSGPHPRGQPPIQQQSSVLTINSRRCSSRAKNSREHTVRNYSC